MIYKFGEEQGEFILETKIHKKSIKKMKVFTVFEFLFVLISIIFCIYMFKNDIVIGINNIVGYQPIEDLVLTDEDKLSDFDSFYEIVTTSFPNIEEVKNTYSIDFKNKKDYYKNLIKQTDSNFEYYCLMTAIIEDLASYHTGFCFPEYESIKSLNCYNLDNVLSDKNLKPFTDYWNKLIETECKKMSKINVAEFKYIDGKYIFDSKWSSDAYFSLMDCSIVSIDGINVDEFISNNLSIYKLQFDSKNQKPYRRVLTLNESHGKKIRVKLENKYGDLIEEYLYISIEMEMINTYKDVFSDESNSKTSESIYHYNDTDKNILYVSIKNFNNNGNELKNIFQDIDSNTKIIIDLRDNYGGNTNYAKNYIYPYLYNQDINFENSWFVPSSDFNDSENKKLKNKLLYNSENIEGGRNFKSHTKYNGGNNDYRENIYYIVNTATASAADEYIAMVKKNNLGTIVGTNTAGEGLGGSFSIYMLKNSGWVFTYYPCQAYDLDLKNNAIFGTSPNKYISQSIDSFCKQREYEIEGIDIEEYENRLKWDNVLIDIISFN